MKIRNWLIAFLAVLPPILAQAQGTPPGIVTTNQLGAANGVAPLDGTAKVPLARLPTGTSGTTLALGTALQPATVTGIAASSGSAFRAAALSDLTGLGAVSVSLSGCTACAGDGTTDDTAALQAFLNANPGATVSVPAGKAYLLNSGNLTIPAKTTLRGSGNPMIMMQGIFDPVPPSVLYLNPAYTIYTSTGSAIENLAIMRAGMVSAPSSAQVIADVATWAADPANGNISTGIVISANAGGGRIHRVYIEGFNTAIVTYPGQYIISDVVGDDYNGIYATGGGDVLSIQDVRFEPFRCIHSSNCNDSPGAWDRPGVALYLQGASSNVTMNRYFSLQYHQGLILDGISFSQIIQMLAEWDVNPAYSGAGTSAVRAINNNADVFVKNAFSNGQAIDFDMESPHGVTIDSPRVSPVSLAGSAGVAPFYLGTNSATPVEVTFSGTVSAGQLVSITITDSALQTSPQTVYYQPLATDTLTTIASSLERQINGNSILAAQHIYANFSGGAVTVYWPSINAVTPSITSNAAGGLSVAQSAGSGVGGSSGELINITMGDTAHPTIYAPHDTGTWNISNIAGGIYSGWASIATNNGVIQFNGVYDYGTPAITGTGCSNATGANRNSEGSIVEIGGTGCTVTFATPWPFAPQCSVTPYGSIQPAVTPPTATGFSWTATVAGAQAFRYKCDFY